ncbi:RHO GTPase-activating RGD1-like [Lecanosticta acicola]|uniref:RHO GTPase-activating RGD1-like n=1 Tax=Lecanosticta acicola TaxID=111012 RepID=A0AAI8W1F6_9PEZI|nr:RHO GTPase-activating RGD1-like [Lecanosticta acicola]
MSGEFNRDEINGDAAASPALGTAPPVALPSTTNGGSTEALESPVANPPGSSGSTVNNNGPTGLSKAVEEVMYSDIGINTLLNRLKQSIASARDFAQFLRRRSSLEEEQAKGLKKLAQQHLEDMKKGDKRGGSWGQQLSEVLRIHERMADNGMQFALSLHQMHEDMDVLSANMERGRKQWKHEGLDAEKKASDAEQAMQKAKARYDSLAEDYDRARTGDTKGSRRIGLKGPKSAEQYEQDINRKMQAADEDYKEKVRQAASQREQLVKVDRPKAVKALQELIQECDSALTLQLQKFATFNEKLLLGNGLAVSPLADRDGPAKSMRDLVQEIDNERDFHGYLGGHSGKVTRPSEIRYEAHPTQAPKTQLPKTTTQPAQPPASQPLTLNTASSQPSSMHSKYATQQPPQSSYSQQPPSSSYGYPQGTQDVQAPSYATNQSPYSPQTQVRDAYNSTPPYPMPPSDRTASGFNSHQQTTGSIPAAPPQITPSSFSPTGSTPTSAAPPSGKGRVFGVSLDELFTRDQSAVPIIVFQCIQAVDIFGLESDGIYRHNGTHSHVNALRQKFDTLPPSSQELDFRNPSNFYHDVNAVGSLLKQFFRELPDPLFTRVGYSAFIAAAKEDHEDQRRDGLHQAINDLPDPNYATLRALVLHLSRVSHNVAQTRMTSENLAVCFAPTLMGANSTAPGANNANLADASWQTRALSTILANATAIFDED